MSINVIVLLGNAGRDPELRFFESGSCVCEFTLAINRPPRAPVDLASKGGRLPQFCRDGRVFQRTLKVHGVLCHPGPRSWPETLSELPPAGALPGQGWVDWAYRDQDQA